MERHIYATRKQERRGKRKRHRKKKKRKNERKKQARWKSSSPKVSFFYLLLYKYLLFLSPFLCLFCVYVYNCLISFLFALNRELYYARGTATIFVLVASHWNNEGKALSLDDALCSFFFLFSFSLLLLVTLRWERKKKWIKRGWKSPRSLASLFHESVNKNHAGWSKEWSFPENICMI